MIPSHSLIILLLQLAVLLALAMLLGRLAARLNMPAIAGELLAGVLLGPSLFGWLAPRGSAWLFPPQPDQQHMLNAVGEVGLLLLVGLTGMEMDFGLVSRSSKTAIRISLAGIIIPFASGIGLGFATASVLKSHGVRAGVFALFLGVAMCVTAIPVISKTLIDMDLLHRNVGQLALAAAAVDDTFGWLMLSVVSALAASSLTTEKIGTALLYPLLVVAFAVLLGRPLARFILRLIGDASERVTAVVVVLIMLSAAATQSLKLEAIFGAFVCGAVIGSCGELKRSTIAGLRPLVLAFLAPVYFTTAGLQMNLRTLSTVSVIAAAAVILLVAIAGKFIGAYLSARISGLSYWEALALGAAMNSRGIVEVVVATVGLQTGVLGVPAYTIIILVAVVTSLIAPPILRLAMRRVEYTPEEETRRTELSVGR